MSFIQEYSWDDHGFFQADSLYKDIATLLDEKFKIAINLTYNTYALSHFVIFLIIPCNL